MTREEALEIVTDAAESYCNVLWDYDNHHDANMREATTIREAILTLTGELHESTTSDTA